MARAFNYDPILTEKAMDKMLLNLRVDLYNKWELMDVKTKDGLIKLIDGSSEADLVVAESILDGIKEDANNKEIIRLKQEKYYKKTKE